MFRPPGSALGSTVEIAEIETLADGSIIVGDGSGAPTTLAAFSSATGTLKPANGGTGVANNAASTLAISGNFATTLTVTGTTGVTLPTSGTLLASGGALGTPSSGTLTSCTGLPVAGLANGTDGELITWDASGVAATVAVGTATHVLTSNGAGAAPTFQAIPASGISFVSGFSTDFSTAARYTEAKAGGGSSAVFGTTGADIRTTASAGYSSLTWAVSGATPSMFDQSGVFSTNIANTALGTDNFQSWSWVGPFTVTTNTLTFVDRHYGFRTDKTSGTSNDYASNADGTTETVTDIGATINPGGGGPNMTAYKNSTTNIKFYYGSTLKATHTTNLPTGGASTVATSCGLTNKNTADDGDMQITYQSWGAIV